MLLRPGLLLQGTGSVPFPAWSLNTVALIVLLQGIYCNPPLCSRHTNQPGTAWPIGRQFGPCSAPDAIRNPSHEDGLSQAVSPASGVRGLSGGVWALAQTPPRPPPPAPDCTGASSSSWSRARTCPIQRVFRLGYRAGSSGPGPRGPDGLRLLGLLLTVRAQSVRSNAGTSSSFSEAVFNPESSNKYSSHELWSLLDLSHLFSDSGELPQLYTWKHCSLAHCSLAKYSLAHCSLAHCSLRTTIFKRHSYPNCVVDIISAMNRLLLLFGNFFVEIFTHILAQGAVDGRITFGEIDVRFKLPMSALSCRWAL